MSGLVCSITGSPLIDGVACTKTGHLYQRSTILQYINIYNQCPFTKIPLSKQDLITLAQTNTIITPSQQNIPALVQKLTNQLDTVILQTHLLKKTLKQRRQQLATSLYRQDATIRVIAKLKDQRDNARNNISILMKQIGQLQNS